MKTNLFTSSVLALTLAATSAAWADGFDYENVSATSPDYFTAGQRASGVMGKPALSKDETKLGDVTDVIFNDANALAGYMVNMGGFLGIDGTSVYIPYDQTDLRIDGIAVEIIVNMSGFDIKTAANLE